MARENADELLSYGSPRRSFSASLSRSAIAADADGDARAGGSPAGDVQALLAFYRQRCEQFQQERQTMLDHVARIEVSKEEFHRLKWELRMKSEEFSELEDSLKKANATLFGVKSEMVDLRAENKKLRIQEAKDRLKVQHLLALTQPITEEVTFFRDCRPGTSASYPIAPTPTPQTYSYPSTMHISSEIRRSQPRRQSQPTRSTIPSSAAAGSRASVRVSSSGGQTNKVLRTVYLPNEQAAMLSKTVESLQDQLVAHQELAEERIQTLLDEFATEKANLTQQISHLEDKTQSVEKQLEKAQKLLHQTTKDYLVLRHQSQEAERLAHEELYQLQQKCETLSSERKQVLQQAVAETQALKKSVQEEGDAYTEEFRSQALSRERDLHILKEQYAAVQEACTRRIQDLQARLTKLRSRYRSLDKRRAMEMEGFTRDIVSLKRHLQKLEVMHYGRRLTVQERQNMRLDEHYTLDSNELSEEVTALQQRVMELAADLARKSDVLREWQMAIRVNWPVILKSAFQKTSSQTALLYFIQLVHAATDDSRFDDEAADALRAPIRGRFALGDSVTRSIETSEATFAGKGCVAPEDMSVVLSADGKELRVAFKSDFVAKSAEGSTHTRVACNGVIPMEVPTGYSVGISKDALEGFVSIPSKEKGSDAEAHYVQVTSEFFFAAQRRGPKLKQRFETPGVARFSVGGLPSETIWSSCGAAQARLRINTALIAHGNASTIGFGSPGTDKEVQGNSLRFAISYKKCTSAGDDKAEADEVDGDEADSDEEQASEV